MSRHIVHGFDPASDSWKAALAAMPKLDLALNSDCLARIDRIVCNQTKRDQDPKRCARKSWTLGAFTLVTLLQALQILIAQGFRCAVTANELTWTPNQLNSMRCACSADCFALTVLTTFCSLDAIDPRKPHTADNVQWVCARINLGDARALLRLRLCTCSLAAHPL
jgi:hypothetical protein